MRAVMAATAALDRVIAEQRGALFPWVPVCMAMGIGLYFGLSREPEAVAYAGVVAGSFLRTVLAWRWSGALGTLALALALIGAGFTLAGWRAHRLAAPVLEFRMYGAVEGRVVGLDRSASDAPRVTLDQVRLAGVSAARTPERVRISLHGDAVADDAMLRPGTSIMTTANMSPPQGPAEPGGFDFRRHAWFQSLGAVGYSRVPVLRVAAPEPAPDTFIFAIRQAISHYVRAELPGDIGGFAAAITTGDRSGIRQAALNALRASNLAHLLAISGLHMGLLAGFVFGALRLGLALVPVIALRWPTKRIAACGALIAATAYLALSGGNVATERAYVMVAVALVAVLCSRRALSLRAVAVAAVIVLSLRPEALLGPGFQMSFAATTALVAVFNALRDDRLPRLPGWARPVAAVVISSAVAGAATAPVGAAHFNTLSHYGLIANLSSVPLMGVLVVPAAVLALCLAPLGLDWIGLWLVGLGLRWILWVAETVSGWDGAQGFVAAPHWAVLPLLAFGALVVVAWQGRGRWLGAAPMLAALLLWAQVERPEILIADTGTLVGVATEAGRALSKARGAGFVAGIWLENDGDGAGQQGAAARWPSAGKGEPLRIALGGQDIIHLSGKRMAAAYSEIGEPCAEGQIIVSSVKLALSGPCLLFDPVRLRQTGSLAISGGRVTSARDATGARLWNTSQRRQ